MAISTRQMLDILAPDCTKLQNNQPQKNQPLQKFPRRSFETTNELDSLLECIQFYCPLVFTDVNPKDLILDTLKNYDLIDSVNWRKIINVIDRNVTNNELLVFLTLFLDMDICVFCDYTRILKIFYTTNKLNTNKPIMLLFKTNTNFYQAYNDYYDITYIDIETMFPGVFQIAIGLDHNKLLNVCDQDEELENEEYILGRKLEHVIKSYINELNIMDCEAPVLETKTYTNYTDDLPTLINYGMDICKKYKNACFAVKQQLI